MKSTGKLYGEHGGQRSAGVQLITSDGHRGLMAARLAIFGGVPWQRCQFHLRKRKIFTICLMRIPESAGLLIRHDIVRRYIQPRANDIGVTSFCKCSQVGHTEHAYVGNNLGLRPTICARNAFRTGRLFLVST
jgi:hypothetical protein